MLGLDGGSTMNTAAFTREGKHVHGKYRRFVAFGVAPGLLSSRPCTFGRSRSS